MNITVVLTRDIRAGLTHPITAEILQDGTRQPVGARGSWCWAFETEMEALAAAARILVNDGVPIFAELTWTADRVVGRGPKIQDPAAPLTMTLETLLDFESVIRKAA